MNKLKILSILLSIAILTLLVAGCFGGNKTTGGGWFEDFETGNYVTFGFNVQPVGEPYFIEDLGPEGAWVRDAKGQFQLIDQTLGIKIQGAFSTASVDLTITDSSAFMGTCSVKGVGSLMFMAAFNDEADANFVSIGVDIDDNGELDKGGDDIFYEGVLGGGSIRIHAK